MNLSTQQHGVSANCGAVGWMPLCRGGFAATVSSLRAATTVEIASDVLEAMTMPGRRFARLIEKNADALAKGAVKKVQSSERMDAYRNIPSAELERDLYILCEHLGEWLDTKTELDVYERYSRLGQRRARQGVPVEQLVWGITLAKEHIWGFMLREGGADHALELLNELDFFLSLEQFFDRATYYAIVGHKQALREGQAA